MQDIIEASFDQIRELRATKGKDYSTDADTLANFKEQAAALGLTPEQVWGVFAGKHWAAIMTYCRKGDVASEPIEGRIDDAILYLLLLKGLAAEARGGADNGR